MPYCHASEFDTLRPRAVRFGHIPLSDVNLVDLAEDESDGQATVASARAWTWLNRSRGLAGALRVHTCRHVAVNGGRQFPHAAVPGHLSNPGEDSDLILLQPISQVQFIRALACRPVAVCPVLTAVA